MDNYTELKKKKKEAYQKLWREIVLETRRGDTKLVEEMTGKDYSTVSKVLSGDRQNIEILNAFKRIIDNRKELLKK